MPPDVPDAYAAEISERFFRRVSLFAARRLGDRSTGEDVRGLLRAGRARSQPAWRDAGARAAAGGVAARAGGGRVRLDLHRSLPHERDATRGLRGRVGRGLGGDDVPLST